MWFLLRILHAVTGCLILRMSTSVSFIFHCHCLAQWFLLIPWGEILCWVENRTYIVILLNTPLIFLIYSLCFCILMDFKSEIVKSMCRNFAKRQLTWFRNERIYHWLDASKPLVWHFHCSCNSNYIIWSLGKVVLPFPYPLYFTTFIL